LLTTNQLTTNNQLIKKKTFYLQGKTYKVKHKHMCPVKLLSIALMLTGVFFLGEATAQIKIGDEANIIEKASLLELQSTDKGLLLPRMQNTNDIDALGPKPGMLIYITDPAREGIYVRKLAGWELLGGSLNGNPTFNTITAASFIGPLTGTATEALDAQNAKKILITNDVLNPNPVYPTFVSGTGVQSVGISNTKLIFKPSTGELTAPIFKGDLDGNAKTASSVSGTVAAVNGGTGQANYTPGDLLYANTTTSLQRLGIGTPSQFLKVGTTSPTWGSVILSTDVTGILPAANGGTGVANSNKLTWTGADIILSATGTTNVTLPTAGTLVTINGTEALTSKTINGNIISNGTPGTTLTIAQGKTFATTNENITLNAAVGGSNLTLPSSGILVAAISNAELLSFGTVGANSSKDVKFTVPFSGAALGDAVSLGVPIVSMPANGMYAAWVSAANEVTVRFINNTAGAIVLLDGTFKAKVLK